MRAGTIFKRFDAGKLFTLTCQDVAERFHLGLSLLFVVVEEMDNAGSGRPNTALLQRCAAIFAAEVAIDVTKHAVVTKFSDVRPGVYRTFLHVRLGIISGRTSAAPLTLHAALAAQCCVSGFHVNGQRTMLLEVAAASCRATSLYLEPQVSMKSLLEVHASLTALDEHGGAQDVCEKTRGSQSHTAHRVVAFEPYAPAALFLRIAATYLGTHRPAAGVATSGGGGLFDARALAGRAGWVGCAALAWVVLFAAKAALGFCLRAAAVHHLRRAARRAR